MLFARGISHGEQTHTPLGAERVLLLAMDELEYALLDPRVGESASSRLFLHCLSPVSTDPETLSQVRLVLKLSVEGLPGHGLRGQCRVSSLRTDAF